jgi:hypothetical protein
MVFLFPDGILTIFTRFKTLADFRFGCGHPARQ